MPCKNHPLVDDRLLRCTRCADSFCPDCTAQIGGHPYCAVCQEEVMRDLRSGPPVQPARRLQMATVGRRFLSLFVDQMILMIPAVGLMLAIAIPSGLFKEGAAMPETSPAFLMFQVLLSLAWAGFGVVYEGTMLASGGQTIGKKLLRIKVVTPEGNDITSGQAWTRAVVRQAMGIVLCLGLVDYLVAFGQERTCIHDQAARTRVVDWNG